MDLRVFIDTEFTDFRFMKLISIGAVSESGEEFYMEISDYDKIHCSDFVGSVVLPLLSGGDVLQPFSVVGSRFASWLSELSNKHKKNIVLVYDYSGDGLHCSDLLSGHKIKKDVTLRMIKDSFYDVCLNMYNGMDSLPQVRVLNGMSQLEKAYEKYFEEYDSNRHNALVDARALRYAWGLAMAEIAIY